MNLDCTLNFTINNKEMSLPLSLSKKQLLEIQAVMQLADDTFSELSGWEEPQVGEVAYYEDALNQVASFEITEDTLPFALELYENDNFFCTQETAENTIRADNVLRRLRHYAVTHRKSDTHMAEGGYTITFNYHTNSLEIGATGNWLALGDVVFDTEKTARDAINKYAAELTWYFTSGKVNM